MTWTNDGTETESIFLLFQLFPTLIVNLGALSAGLSLGYSAIALPQLKPYMDGEDGFNSDHYRPFTLNEEEGSWIGEERSLK